MVVVATINMVVAILVLILERTQMVGMLKALHGPLPELRFCPTGGITPDNLQRYMAQPIVMCVGGTWMFQREWVENSDWARIQQCSVEALQLLG